MGDPNYVVHGAGAIGSVLAARLSEAGARVGLVARGLHLGALQDAGLRLSGQTVGTYDLPAAATAHDLEVDEDTVVILAMKSGDTEQAVAAHSDLYADLPIVCSQNGVTNEQLLSEAGYRVYGCTVMVCAAISAPGEVSHSGGELLSIGCWPDGNDEVSERLVADLVAGSMKARTHPHIEANKWGKLVRNLGNAHLALTNLSVQEAICQPSDRWFLADVQEEAANALDAAGIDYEFLGRRTMREQIENLRTEGIWRPQVREDPTVRSYPSTWQDLDARRPTVEVDHFNGTIVRLGEQHGVSTALNRVLRDVCEAAAAALLGPGSETTESLRALAAR